MPSEAWRDNVFVNRLCRTIKDERVCPRAYDGVSAAKTDIAQFMDWNNIERPHSSLDDQAPDQTTGRSCQCCSRRLSMKSFGAPRAAHRGFAFVASEARLCRQLQHLPTIARCLFISCGKTFQTSGGRFCSPAVKPLRRCVLRIAPFSPTP